MPVSIRPDAAGTAECLDTLRVPLHSSAVFQHVQGFGVPQAFAIGTIHRHRAERIGDGQQARQPWDFLVGKPCWAQYS